MKPLSDPDVTRSRGRWFRAIDISELICSLVVSVIWGCLSLVRPNPLFIPEGDSLSSFPYVEHDPLPTVWLAVTVFGSVSAVIWVMFFVRRKFELTFRQFNAWSATWIHVTSVGVTNIVVSLLNIYVGRVRPDFYKRCGTSATPDTCSVLSAHQISEEMKSFPSAHAATALSGFLFMTLFLQKLTRSVHTWTTCIYLLPVILGFWIGAMRIRAYKNHTDDVIGGFVIAAICTGVIWHGSCRRIFRKLHQEQSEVTSS